MTVVQFKWTECEKVYPSYGINIGHGFCNEPARHNPFVVLEVKGLRDTLTLVCVSKQLFVAMTVHTDSI